MPSKWQKNKAAPGPGRYSQTVPTFSSWRGPWHGLDNSRTPQTIPGLAFGGLAGWFQCGHLIFESRRFLAWGHNKSLPVGHRANLAIYVVSTKSDKIREMLVFWNPEQRCLLHEH